MESNFVIDVSNRVYKMVMALVIVLAIAVVFVGVGEMKKPSNKTPQQISFTGDGKAYGKPDVALVSLGVHSDAQKSQDAVDQNNVKMNEIVKAIKELGIADADIKTTLYNLSPTYATQNQPSMYPYVASKVVGYALDQQVEVKIRDLSKINSVLDKATSLGANTVGALQFIVDKQDALQSEARAEAIAKAQAKMAEIVKTTGINIGKLVNVTEGYNYPQPMYGIGGASMMKDSVAPQIQAGQQEVSATVTLIYEVK